MSRRIGTEAIPELPERRSKESTCDAPRASINGHVYRSQGSRADAWYAKWRGVDGRQHERRLGPAWTRRGRPAAGYLTKRPAEDELRRIPSEEEQGVRMGASARDVTLAEAAEEWLR